MVDYPSFLTPGKPIVSPHAQSVLIGTTRKRCSALKSPVFGVEQKLGARSKVYKSARWFQPGGDTVENILSILD